MEEGLISRGGKYLGLPLCFGLRPQCPCRVGTVESGLVLSEEGKSACLPRCSGGIRPLVELCLELRVFPCDARGCQCPFVLCLPPQGCFEDVSGHRVLLRSGPENQGRSACGTTLVARLEFPRESGLILRCTGKARNAFQTMQGNRLYCRDQEGRRGSDEVVPGPSVFPSREPGVSGNSWGSHEGCQVPYPTSGRSMGLPLRCRRGQGPHLAKTLEPRGFY